MSEALTTMLEFGRAHLAIGALVALLCGLLSVQVILNRIVFVAAALGQLAAAGIALALLMHLDHTACSMAATFLGVVYLASRRESRSLPAESRLGIVYVTGGALSVLLVVKSAAGREEVSHLLEGSLLFATWDEVGHLATVVLLVAGVLSAAFRHLVLVGFDPDGARAMGYQVEAWRGLLYLLVGLAVGASTHSTGLLLSFSYLVLPGAIALTWVRSLRLATVASALVAVAASVLGLWISYNPAWDLPPAPVVVLLLVAAHAGSSLVAWARNRQGAASRPSQD